MTQRLRATLLVEDLWRVSLPEAEYEELRRFVSLFHAVSGSDGFVMRTNPLTEKAGLEYGMAA